MADFYQAIQNAVNGNIPADIDEQTRQEVTADAQQRAINSNDYSDVVQFMSNYGISPKQTENEETKDNGPVGWFKDAVDSGIAGVLGGQTRTTGTFFGVGNDAADYFNDMAKRNSRIKEYTYKDLPPFSSDYWTNPQGALYDIGNMAGSGIALGGEVAAAVGAAYALGAPTLASVASTLATRAAAHGMTGLASALNSKFAPLIIGKVLTTIPEIVSEGGNTIDNIKADGGTLSEQKAGAIKDMVAQAPWLTISNLLEASGLGTLLGSTAKSVGGKLAKGAAGVTGSAMQNAWEEGMQQASQNYGEGKRDSALSVVNPFGWQDDELTSAASAIAPGALFGTAGALGSHFVHRGEDMDGNAGTRANAKNNTEYNSMDMPQNDDEMESNSQGEIESDTQASYGNGNDIVNTIIDAANQYGIDPKIALAIAMRESGGDTVDGISMSDGGGMFQILPDTDIRDGNGGRARIEDLYPDYQTDPQQNALAGMAVLKDKIEDAGGDMWDGVNRYNGGGDAEYLSKVRSNYDSLQGEDSSESGRDGWNGMSSSRPMPIADGIEDAGLTQTNTGLRQGIDALNTWVYDTFGKDLTVSGGWRSPENNAAVNGAEGSRHLSGLAVDVDASGLTEDELAQVEQKAKEMGFNADGEDMYHDKGSGYHLHLSMADGADIQGANESPALQVQNMKDGKEDMLSVMKQFMTDNQHTYDADTNNAIDDALESNNPEKIAKVFQSLPDNPDSMQKSLADMMVKTNSEKSANMNAGISDNLNGNMAATAQKIPLDEWEPTNVKHSNTVSADKQNPIPVRKMHLVPDLDNSKLVDMTKRAFHGDTKAMETFQKLRPEVQQQLRQVAGVDNLESAQHMNPEKQPNTTSVMSRQELTNHQDAISKRPAGKTVQVVTDDGTEFRTQYKLVDARELITSHTPNNYFEPNKKYPQELQPRNRQNTAMRQQVVQMAGALRPADVAGSRNLNNGAPLINANGIVENGNGRSMAIIRALKGGHKSGLQYKQYLKDHAAEFGFTPDQIESMQHPVLVRQRMDDVDIRKIINSTAGGATLSASEQAHADAKAIRSVTLGEFTENENGDLTTKDNQRFVHKALMDVTSSDAGKMNALLTSDGKVSQQGISRIRNALFAKAYKDSDLLSIMSESTDNNIRNITNALTNCAPYIAGIQTRISEGTLYDIDFVKPIIEACKKMVALRESGKPVQIYLQEQSMFGENISDIAKDVLNFFDKNKRGMKRIRDMIMDAGNIVEKLGDPHQTTMFDDQYEIPSAGDILETAVSDIMKTQEFTQSKGVTSHELSAPHDISETDQTGADAGTGTTQSVGTNRRHAGSTETPVRSQLQQSESEGTQSDQQGNRSKKTVVREAETGQDLVQEAAQLYEQAAQKFPSITDEAVRDRVKKAIQTTLDFGEQDGGIHVVAKNNRKAKDNPVFYQPSLFDDSDDSRRRGLRTKVSLHDRNSKQIGFGLTRKLINEGVVSLVGKTVNNIQELAEIAQVLRHPGYEKFHKVYVKGNKVVYHDTVTCMLPSISMITNENENSVQEMMDNMVKNADRYGADTVYILHNHPSGNVMPSKADLSVTGGIENKVTSTGLNFGGHIILDTTKCFLLANGSGHEENIPKHAQIHYDTADIPHIALGKNGQPDELIKISKQLADRSKTTAIFMDNQFVIRGVVQLPDGFKNLEPDRMNRYLRLLTRNNQSRWVSIITADTETYHCVSKLVDTRESILDAVLTTDNRTASNTGPDYDYFMGLNPKQAKGKKVLENTGKYRERRDTQKLHYKSDFKPSDNSGGFSNAHYQVAVHATPHIFDEFDLKHIGSGEGAQVHGYGLYFGNIDNAEHFEKRYRDRLIDNNENGQTIHINKKETIVNTEEGLLNVTTGEVIELDQPKGIAIQAVITAEGNIKEAESILNNFVDMYGADSIDKAKAYLHDNDISYDNVQKGQVITAEIPENDVLMDEQKPLSRQSPAVQKGVKKAFQSCVDLAKPRDLKNDYIENVQNFAVAGKENETGNLVSDILAGVKKATDENIAKIECALISDFYDMFDKKGRFDIDNVSDRQLFVKNYLYGYNRAQTVENLRSKQALSEIERKVHAIIDDKKYLEFTGDKVQSHLKDILMPSVGPLHVSKEISKTLNVFGIEGYTYNGQEDGRCYVIFNPKAIAVKERYDAAIEAHGNEIKRSYDDVLSQVKKAFPNGKFSQDGNAIHVAMPNGARITVDIKDEIVKNDKEAGNARKAHGLSERTPITFEGSWRRTSFSDLTGLIEVSRESRNGAAYHEAYHATWDMALTNTEKSAMLKHYEAAAKEKRQDVQEVMADAYQKWVLGRQRGQGSVFGKLFQRIYDFAKKMQSILTGIDNVHDVMRRIENGEVWQRGTAGKDGVSTDNDNIPDVTSVRYSVRNANENLVQRLSEDTNKKTGGIEVQTAKQSVGSKFGGTEYWIRSPSYLAQKFPQVRGFFKLADKAMQRQEELRSQFDRIMNRAYKNIHNSKERKEWQHLLWLGDTMGTEFTSEELSKEGYAPNVIRAYVQTRNAVKKAYTLLNDARTQTSKHQKNMSGSELRDLQQNIFAEIMKITPKGRDRYLVVWKQQKTWINKYTVSKQVLDDMRNGTANYLGDTRNKSQILSIIKTGADEYTIETREGVRALANRKGYIPHFFHDYFVMRKEDTGETDANGSPVYQYTVVGSGRTVRDAYKKAKGYLKENPDVDLVIQPKQFSFDKDEYVKAVVIGDTEYRTVVDRLAKDMEMTPEQAKELLDGKFRMKARHRFFGNFMRRKGAEGFEQDIDWALRHYFNATSRYIAMEGFKPQAIGLFERYFGRFDDDYDQKPLAQYMKQYINDMNGNPTFVEKVINDFFNNRKLWRKYVVSNFGERAALQLASNITGKVSILKLGFLNVSSALLNLTQLVNTIGIIGEFTPVGVGMKNAIHPGFKEQRIFKETGIMNNITLDTASGYNKFTPKSAFGKSMYLFRTMDMYARRATVLAAYNKGRKDGMNHDEAIQYAKEVNRKANFDYSVADASNIFRRGSVLSQVALQFKKYPMKEIELMADLLINGNLKQNAKFWGTYFLLCGLFQIPAGDWFDDMFKTIFGYSPKLKAKELIMKVAGKDPLSREIAKIAMYGITAASPLNMDVSARVGVGDVNLDTKNGVAGLIGGPAYSTVTQSAKAIAAYMRNEGGVLDVAKALSPAVANYMQAWAGTTEGFRGRKNRELDTQYDMILKASGFKSADDSIVSDIKQIIADDASHKTVQRKRVIDRVLNYQQMGIPLAKSDIDDMRRLGITGKILQNERRRKGSTANERITSEMSPKERGDNRSLLNFMQSK